MKLKAFFIFHFSFFILLAACGNSSPSSNDGTVEFRSPKSDIVAIRTIQDGDTSWVFNNAIGEPLVPGTDSLWVIADSISGQPLEVIFHHKGKQTLISFWDNMECMAEHVYRLNILNSCTHLIKKF